MASIREVYILEAEWNEIKFSEEPANSFVVVAGGFSYEWSMRVDDTQIRPLTAADGSLFREIRLEALRSNPEAFGSTFEMESVQNLDFFSARLRTSEMLGAFDGTEIVGMAGLLVRTGQKEAHKGLLVSMYVRPQARRRGVGRRLAEAVIDIARQRIELLQLAVVKGNESARQLYANLGFLEYGYEKKALKQDGRYYDEILMAKDLTSQ
jgi:ribosomal protein S18 acetylase RimI-like enzyme